MPQSRGHALASFGFVVGILMFVGLAAALPGCVRSEDSVAASRAAPTPESSRTVQPLMAVAAASSSSAGERPAGQQPSLETATSSSLTERAKQNSVLRDSVEWTFGGKTQRGWRIYLPLISHLIGTDAGADTNDFAAALARWQKSAGLAPSGVLDNATLSAMVSTWQSRRPKGLAPAEADQLFTAPSSDFYDPSRADELRQIERQTYDAYKRMVAAAAADRALGLAVTPRGELAPGEKYLKVISAHRSRAYQEQLRQKFPNSGRAGLAVNSPHFSGRALDIYVGGDPVELKDSNRAAQSESRVYRWLVKNAERFGFRPYFFEPWHWEYRPS